MSQTQNMNGGGEFSLDVERILHELIPEPLGGNRDELFFRAGFAAGERQRKSGWGGVGAWRIAAAALVVMCGVLGAGFYHQSRALQVALAAAGPQAVPESVHNETAEVAEVSPLEMPIRNSSYDLFMRRLASSNWPLSGRLSARGFEEQSVPADLPRVQVDRDDLESSRMPRRVDEYYRWLREQREG